MQGLSVYHSYIVGCFREMAEKALKKVKDQLDCSICLETYTDPKLLQCLHVFCRKCLAKLVVRDQQGQLILTCPICRQDTPVPANGTAGLQPAFHIIPFLEIAEELKKATADLPATAASAETAGGVSTSLTPALDRIKVCCLDHGKEVELYCKPICCKCLVTGAKHQGHDCEELHTDFDKYREEITASLGPMEQQLTTVKKAMAQFERCSGEISDQRAAPDLPDPSKCHVTGKGTEAAVVGETATALLQAIDFRGQPCEEPILSLECELVSELTGTRTPGSVERRGQSQYEISYQPTVKGRHQLHIKVEGRHIRASPFGISAKSSVKKLGDTPILTLDEVKTPWGVAINQRGEVVVTQPNVCRVSVFSASGEKFQSFGSRGSGQGQFMRPLGVAVDDEGNILVADNGNHRIQRFTPEGQFLTAVGTEGSGRLQFRAPDAIAYNAVNSKLYVTDGYRVQVLNSDLTFSNSFGKEGSGKGQFSSTWYVACDRTGDVYVSDFGNHRVQVFTPEGKFLRMFGKYGGGTGELSHPVGVAVDSSDMVYVNDQRNHRVSVFTTEGVFVRSFGSAGQQPGQFVYPRGLCVDSSGVVYVCDTTNNRVQVF